MDVSPSKERIKQLSERLLTLQSGVEEEKLSRTEYFDTYLRSFENKIDSSTQAFESKIKLIKDTIGNIGENVSSERMARELLDERKSKELKLSENNLNIELNLLKQSRKEYEIRVSKLLDERLFGLKLDLAKEKKVREEVSEMQSQHLDENIGSLT